MTEQVSQKTREVTHPLLRREVTSVLWNWPDWKDCWDGEMAREKPRDVILIGLLHFIFSVPGSQEKKVCFLLELADGYKANSNFPKGEEGHIYHPYSDRQVNWNPDWEVVKKAWSMLCDVIFKNTANKPHDPSWASLVAQKEVFYKLLWFFDPERERPSYGADNIPYPHHTKHNKRAKTAIVFLRRFVRFAWEFRSFGTLDHETDKETKEMFFKARPRLMGILSRIHDTHYLLKVWDDIDEASESNLRELALVKKRYSGNKRFGSMAEAYLEGHPSNREAAGVFILLQVKKEEAERLAAITEEKEKAEEAERELEKLSDKK